MLLQEQTILVIMELIQYIWLDNQTHKYFNMIVFNVLFYIETNLNTDTLSYLEQV